MTMTPAWGRGWRARRIKGRLGKKRICKKGMVVVEQPISAKDLGHAMAKNIHGEQSCMKVQTRYNSESWKKFQEKYPDLASKISRIYFINCCPKSIKPAKRDTCLCIYHTEMDTLMKDLAYHQEIITQGASTSNNCTNTAALTMKMHALVLSARGTSQAMAPSAAHLPRCRMVMRSPVVCSMPVP